MRLRSFLRLVVAFIFIQCSAARATTDLVPRASGDLCFLWGHRLALVGDRLFFMHGNYTFDPELEASAQPYLFYLDLSKSFAVEQFIADGIFHTYDLPPTLSPNIADGEEDASAVLWFSNDTLYVTETENSIISFNTSSNEWGTVGITGSNIDFQKYSSEMSVSIPYSGLSFSFSEPDLPGLIRFDASKSTWTNQTTDSGNAEIQVPNVGEGEMVYVPVGKEGVLLLMGGYDISQSSQELNYIPLSKISVYDIASSTWYSVTATGESIPGLRGQFCAVVSASPDQSSFQVTIYGGWYLSRSIDYEDVFVLSVPSFHWIRANATNDFESETLSDIGRSHHRCTTYKDAQIIVMGGSVREGTASPVNETSCKSQYPPIRVLDTTTYIWKSVFDPSIVKYSVPYVVTDVIGGTPEGNATLTGPDGGFNFTALTTIFSQRVQPNPTPTAITSSTTPTASAKPPASHSKSHTGAIAGGVVGGVVAVLFALAAFYFLSRNRRRKAQNNRPITDDARKDNVQTQEDENHSYAIHEMGTWNTPELDSTRRSELPGSEAGNEMDTPTRTK